MSMSLEYAINIDNSSNQAAILSIPSSKTLLRRHLSLRFNDLVGKDVMQTKRDAEREAHFQVKPLLYSNFVHWNTSLNYGTQSWGFFLIFHPYSPHHKCDVTTRKIVASVAHSYKVKAKKYWSVLSARLFSINIKSFFFQQKTPNLLTLIFQVLTPTAKVKPQRVTPQPVTQLASRAQFTLTRKKRCYLSSPSPTELDEPEDDLLCPFGYHLCYQTYCIKISKKS